MIVWVEESRGSVFRLEHTKTSNNLTFSPPLSPYLPSIPPLSFPPQSFQLKIRVSACSCVTGRCRRCQNGDRWLPTGNNGGRGGGKNNVPNLYHLSLRYVPTPPTPPTTPPPPSTHTPLGFWRTNMFSNFIFIPTPSSFPFSPLTPRREEDKMGERRKKRSVLIRKINDYTKNHHLGFFNF